MTHPRKSSAVAARRPRPLALAYIRVSTTKQADEGASLPAQRAILTAECERRGWDLELVTDEGLSGKSLTRRPNLVAALDRLDRGDADALIAIRLDRISRSAVDFLGILNRARTNAWNVVLLDLGLDLSSVHGKAMAGVIAVFAELERELIAERTREGMAQRMAEGVVMGRPQEMCPELRARITAATSAGTSYAELARQLNAEGIPTPRGGRWHASTVRRAAITPDRVCRCSSEGDGRVPAADCPRHAAADSQLSRLEAPSAVSAQVAA